MSSEDINHEAGTAALPADASTESAATETVEQKEAAANLTRRRFLQGAATTVVTGLAASSGGGLILPYAVRAQAAPEKQKLRIAYVGTGGQAGAHHELVDPNGKYQQVCAAYCDVDKTHFDKIKTLAPKANPYTDWRSMFDAELKNFDAVVITTPDHSHAPVASRAIKAGKHVYCEKPLTWSIQEARVLADLTSQKKVATQMGNMHHASRGIRQVVDWVGVKGVIGDVLEVHSWTNRPVWPQGQIDRKIVPVPANLNWDVWVGPAEMLPYREGLHPFAWRGAFDFGCGAIGDMGTHTWDNVFWTMAPDYPSAIELLEIENKSTENFASKTHFKWEFPAKGKRAGFVAHWYSGGWKPPVPEEIMTDPALQNLKDEKGNPRKPGLAESGSVYIGTKGKLYTPGDYANSVRLIPESAHAAFAQTQPELTIPLSPGHKEEWVMASKGEKAWNFPGSNFATYAGPITEVMLLGAIAEKIGEVGFRIECDAPSRTIKTKQAIALAARRSYRRGFEL